MATAAVQGEGQGGGGGVSPTISVTLASGASFPVLTQDEADYVTEHVRLYMEHNRFENIGDLVDLDNILISEVLIYRWGIWLAQMVDYKGNGFDEDGIRAQMQKWGTELRQKKKTLGIDKLSRDRARGEGSLPHYIAQLHYRAGVFGVMREAQAAKVIELGMELVKMLDWAYNVEPEELEEFGLTDAQIIEWLRERFKPELLAIDAHFQENEMRYWVRDQ